MDDDLCPHILPLPPSLPSSFSFYSLQEESPEDRQQWRDEVLSTSTKDFAEFAERLSGLKSVRFNLLSSSSLPPSLPPSFPPWASFSISLTRDVRSFSLSSLPPSLPPLPLTARDHGGGWVQEGFGRC